MVLIIDGQEVSASLSARSLHDTYQLLKANSLSLLSRPQRLVTAEERCVYVAQREVAVAGPEDRVEMLGSEDATTCHIVILRDSNTNTTGLAHLDNDEPEQFLCLEREVRDRSGVRSVTRELESRDYEVTILGGYEDENCTSEDITDTLLSVMQALKATFRLQIAIVGQINTFTKDGVSWPRVYGGGVVLNTGQIFCGKFSYHGPDTDIRALRLSSGAGGLTNIYDSLSGQIIIQPFTYSVLPDAHLWLKRADSFLLRYCSTSPLVEPPDFCENIRSKMKRMISDPRPETIFPGGRSRIYRRHEITGQWILEQCQDDDSLWAGSDLRMQFN